MWAFTSWLRTCPQSSPSRRSRQDKPPAIQVSNPPKRKRGRTFLYDPLFAAPPRRLKPRPHLNTAVHTPHSQIQKTDTTHSGACNTSPHDTPPAVPHAAAPPPHQDSADSVDADSVRDHRPGASPSPPPFHPHAAAAEHTPHTARPQASHSMKSAAPSAAPHTEQKKFS